jgi:hypothetical protein
MPRPAKSFATGDFSVVEAIVRDLNYSAVPGNQPAAAQR